MTLLAPLIAVSLLLWVADGRSTAPAVDAVRLVLDVWLLSHGVPLRLPGGSFGLIPLLLTGLAWWQLWRSGATVARAVEAKTVGGLARVAVSIAVPYGLAGVGAAAWGQFDQVSANPALAGGVTAGFAFLAALLGAIRGTEWGRGALAQLTRVVVETFRAAALATAVLVAVGLVTTLVMFAVSAHRLPETHHHYSLGASGVVGLGLLSLLYLPTVSVWAAAYVLGPGFAVGSGSVVSVNEVNLDALPAFPLFVGIPTTTATTAVSLLLAIPALVGLVTGMVFSHRLPIARTRPVLVGAVFSGLLAGGMLGVLSALASGSAGGGRLSVLGPVDWRVALYGAAQLTVGILVGVVLHRWVAPWFVRLFPGPVKPGQAVESKPEHVAEPEAEPVKVAPKPVDEVFDQMKDPDDDEGKEPLFDQMK